MEYNASDAQPSQKRLRAARACEFCRAKKYRCDEMDPCSRCTKNQVQCVYKNAESLRLRVDAATRIEADKRGPDRSEGGESSLEDVVVSDSNQANDSGSTQLNRTPGDNNDEVNEINPHTLNQEFHGPTSSLAFLAALQRSGPQEYSVPPGLGTRALVSTLHNDSFSPQSASNYDNHSLLQTRYYFRQSQYFLDGYFQNIHFIHPMIDRSQFLTKCEDLWFGRHEDQSRSFISLYFAVMALGALIREWAEDTLEGLGRWEWSRKLFQLASTFMGNLPLKIDLEMVQANIIMAKICQNELDPHLAYMYLGIAARLSLSAGHNRQPHYEALSQSSLENEAISKTWWALYSVEIEMSFALGRPDSLGTDVYHNRALPVIAENETAILTPMVEFARITRKVSAYIYTPSTSIERRLELAAEIENAIDAWLLALPTTIKPQLGGSADSLGLKKDPMWAKKQRHTLQFRYYNAIMVLYRPFLLHVGRNPPQDGYSARRKLDEAVYKCVAAAGSTIRMMHHMYSIASYFRTWWYNTTYTLYAASIIVGYRSRVASFDERAELQLLIDMSIEILQAMDENTVAKKAAGLLQQTSDRVQDTDLATDTRIPNSEAVVNHASHASQAGDGVQDPLPDHNLFLDPFDYDNFDFLSQILPMNEQTFPSFVNHL